MAKRYVVAGSTAPVGETFAKDKVLTSFRKARVLKRREEGAMIWKVRQFKKLDDGAVVIEHATLPAQERRGAA